ncbi:hypothetical protein [Pedosphaera parvula]|uniref:Uncharacterized protein n=1 Tax=Pedosphaera parvula (strain Ellin514) TaxID=320771 RepID=B9XT42_PEDPL|nr:hypothetical protein [Pedosphaera parvula]EEF56990.1 hypothetical protein Cflav_PD0025 [Pedosphaera parvula Ellin514]
MSTNYSALWQVLQNYLIMMPVILLHATGAAVAIMRWNRHPKISRFALIGFGIPLFLNIIMPIINSLIVSSIVGRGANTMYYGMSHNLLLSIVPSISTVFAAVGYLLLILAIFSDRPVNSSQ